MIRYYFLLHYILLGNLSIAQKGTLYFTSKENSRVEIHSNYVYQFSVVDSIQRKISYYTENLPSWLYFNSATHTISGNPQKTGQYPIHLFASNWIDTTDQFFMLTVGDKKTLNILPIGNYITNGTSVYNSYRRDLWRLLHKGYYNFDFIGSWSLHHMGGRMPNYDFDLDHEGHSGWTISDMLHAPDWDSARGNITKWLSLYRPDIVLVELGTNDVFQCMNMDTAFASFSKLVNILRRKNRNVKILIAQIPPLGNQWSQKKLCDTSRTYGEMVLDFNKRVADFSILASTKHSPIVTVDQYSGVDPSKDMYDDIHPNSKGEKIMAERWFNALKPFLYKNK